MPSNNEIARKNTLDLWKLLRTENYKKASELLSETDDFDFSIKDSKGNNALHLVCKGVQSKSDIKIWRVATDDVKKVFDLIIDKMVKDNCKIDEKNHRGEIPYAIAFRYKFAHMCKELLKRTPEPKEVDELINHIKKGGKIPEHLCDVQTKTGDTALHIAAALNNTDAIKQLLSKEKSPISIDARNFISQTPLFFAAKRGRKDAFSFLIKEGADPMLEDIRGSKPFEQAIEKLPFDIIYNSCKKDGKFFLAEYKNGALVFESEEEGESKKLVEAFQNEKDENFKKKLFKFLLNQEQGHAALSLLIKSDPDVLDTEVSPNDKINSRCIDQVFNKLKVYGVGKEATDFMNKFENELLAYAIKHENYPIVADLVCNNLDLIKEKNIETPCIFQVAREFKTRNLKKEFLYLINKFEQELLAYVFESNYYIGKDPLDIVADLLNNNPALFEKLEELIDNSNFNVNYSTGTVLKKALQNGYVGILERLLNLKNKYKNENSILECALCLIYKVDKNPGELKSLDFILELIAKKGEIDYLFGSGESLLQIACKKSDKEAIELILKHKPNVKLLTGNNSSVLDLCLSISNEENELDRKIKCVKLLLEYHPDLINHPGLYGKTILDRGIELIENRPVFKNFLQETSREVARLTEEEANNKADTIKIESPDVDLDTESPQNNGKRSFSNAFAELGIISTGKSKGNDNPTVATETDMKPPIAGAKSSRMSRS